MARTLSADALKVIGDGYTATTRLTVTPPGGVAVEVEHSDGWSVTEAGADAGSRLALQGLKLLSAPDVDDLFEFAGYPGSVYQMQVGIVMGSTTEWVNVFTGRVSEGSAQRVELGVTVSLVDDWSWADKTAFYGEYATTVGASRASMLAEMFGPVIPGLSVIIDANGGYIATAGVYTGSRSQAAANLAKDGLLAAGFNGNGELVIGPLPAIDGNATPLWTFRSDQSGQFPVTASQVTATIVTGSLERTRPWLESLYNAVTVRPGGSDQTWEAQTAKLADTTDARHENYVGFRPFEIVSETIANDCDALALAQYELTRLLRSMEEKVRVSVVLNPAIEKYDPFYLAALPTLDDSGWNGTYIATSVTHAPSEGITTIEGVSSSSYTLGQ